METTKVLPVDVMSASREMDCLILEKVFKYFVSNLDLDWYGYPVKAFYAANSQFIDFTYDENGCNAIMYRNGHDDTSGYAQPVPNFSDPGCPESVQSLMTEMSNKGYLVAYRRLEMPPEGERIEPYGKHLARFTKWDFFNNKAVEGEDFYAVGDDVAEALCRAALKAMGMK